MTSLTQTTIKLDQIDISLGTGAAQSPWPVTAGRPDFRRSGVFTGLTSGNPDFDQLLDRFHVAFGELARTDDDTSTAVADAADDLSTTYTSITGRSQPQADDSAGALAATLQHGLAALPTSLTDRLGQSMLRLL
jgi:hypothetical protein